VLRSSADDLCQEYDLAMLDLDGVVYIGHAAVDGAAEALTAARARGLQLAFVTNNAARPPEEVARHLRSIGVPAISHDVVTSAQAAARLVASELPAGARVLALGGPGVAIALEQAGLVPVQEAGDGPAAVVTGYGPELTWRQIMRATVLIRDGLPWVACNTDQTIPTDYGVGPGHGVLVEMISGFSGVTPVVAGKPRRPLLDETIRRVGGDRPLMVGDRLDTDVEGAANAGIESLLVLTGVTGLAELVAAPPAQRPTYLSSNLAGLLQRHAAPMSDSAAWTMGGWQAVATDRRLRVFGEGSLDDWWRVVASAAWSWLDTRGGSVEHDDLRPGLPTSRTDGR
jgi:glycerol 3-phosphatase-2